MAEHDVAPLGERHPLHNWQYADAAARLAATGFIPADVTKWAKQLDNGSYWELTDDSPITWEQRTGPGIPPADHATEHQNGGGDEISVAGLSGVLADPQIPITENVQDIVGAMVVAGTNVSVNYDDTAGTLMIESTAGAGGSFSGTGVYRLLPYDQLPSSDVGAVVGANEVYVVKFFLPMELVVASVHFSVNTTNAGSNVAIGVYSADGNTKHIDSGPVSGATTGVKSVTLGSPVTLPSGFYWFAWTATDSTVRLSAIQTTLPWYSILIGGSLQEGKGANASSSGNLPSTLGAIGTTGQTPVPIAKLQG